MANPVLSVEEVREFIQDKVEKNHLLDDNEFAPTQIQLAMEMAVDRFNMIIPIGSTNVFTFPSKTLLLYGTLANLFAGQAALLARNTMNYSDGGISIPVEERSQLYVGLAEMYEAAFATSAKALKLQANIEDGWGMVRSDYAYFPTW